MQGKLYYAYPIVKQKKERINTYEWQENAESNCKQYEPNGIIQMMAVLPKWLTNKDYIGEISKKKEGTITKYTLKTNDAFAKYARENVHRVEEDYTVIEHCEIYWIDEKGLLIKHKTYDEVKWTIDGVTDTYFVDVTVKLTSYNDKKLKSINK